MKQLLTRIKNKFIDNRNEIIRTLLLLEGFGFCFSLSCICGYRLDKYDSVCMSPVQVISGIVLALVCGALIAVAGLISAELIAAHQIDDVSADKPLEDKSVNRNVPAQNRFLAWGISSVVLIICWMPAFLAYYPAVFSYDAEAQLYQVISGNYNTHHPLLHTWIMGLCMKAGYSANGINTGMALYAGTQLVVMAAICGWGAAEMVRLQAKRTGILLYMLFLMLFPVHAILAVSTTKDVVFAGLVLIYTLLLRRFVCENRRGIWDASKIIAVTVFMLLFRNNASYALAVVLLVLVIIFIFGKNRKENSKLLAILGLAFVISIVAGAFLKAAFHAESGSPREALAIPIQQMARVKMLHADELDGQDKADLDMLIADEWADRYDEHLADPIKERISMKQPRTFVMTWIKLGVKYPGDYIDAWLLTTEGAWYIRDRSCNRIYGEGSLTGFGYLSTDIRNMPEGFEVYDASVIPGLRAFLEKIVSDNAFEDIPVIRLLFAPALYVWILILYAFWLIYSREYKKLIVISFLAAYLLTIMMSPAILVRYVYPYMLVVIMPLLDRKCSSDGVKY